MELFNDFPIITVDALHFLRGGMNRTITVGHIWHATTNSATWHRRFTSLPRMHHLWTIGRAHHLADFVSGELEQNGYGEREQLTNDLDVSVHGRQVECCTAVTVLRVDVETEAIHAGPCLLSEHLVHDIGVVE